MIEHTEQPAKRTNSTKEDRERAKILYVQGYTEEEIAEIYNRHRTTIYDWKREGDWDTARSDALLSLHTSGLNLMEILAYNTEAVKRICSQRRENDEWAVLDPRIIQTLKTCVDAVERIKPKNSLSDEIEAIKRFALFVRQQDPEAVKLLQGLLDAYITEKAKGK